MKVKINQKDYEIPFDPNLITLKDYIDYYNQYGNKLDAEVKEVLNATYENEEDKIIVLDNLFDKQALAWFSFWTKLDLLELANTPNAMPLINSFRTLKYLLRESEDAVELPKKFTWKGDLWQIQDFKVNPQSEMSFNEIITSKEVMRQMFELEGGKMLSLLYLSAIFFRKVGEPYIDSMIHENSERLKLMSELPLTYALNVSFFLNICVSFWKITSRPSKTQED